MDYEKNPKSDTAQAAADKAGPDVEIANSLSQQGDQDVAVTFLAGLDPSITEKEVTKEEARKVLWKIDLIILPLVAATIILAAVDKVIISNAAIYGMREDAHLTSDQYSWVGSIFYFGYLVLEYPSAILIQRLPVAKLLAGAVFSWGVIMMCIAATHNFGGLATCRFIMGMSEALIFPVSSILTVMWWTREEQPIRVAFWFNQGSSIFSGIISYGIGHTHTSIAPWRLLFLVLGGYSFLWAVVIWFFLPDTPVTCRWLSAREKYICLRRVKDNKTGIEDRKIKWYQIKECLTDPKTWALATFAVAQNIPNGGLVTFAAIIVSGLGYSKLNTTLLGIPTGVLATVWQLMLAFLCAHIPNIRCLTIAVANLVPMICAILMWKLPRDNKHGLLAAYYVFYTYWAPYVLATSLPMANTSGHSKKVTMNAIFFVSYCLGNILGPQVFRSSDAPDYSHGYIGLLCCIVVAIGSIIVYGCLCFFENKRRAAAIVQAHELGAAHDTQEDMIAAFQDLTDREKKTFVYTY
ncbi:MFS-type transporter cnsL [Exophiala dermatitidis]